VDEIADLIRALAALAWPTVLVVFLWSFKDELRRLLGRLERASGPGVDLAFARELDELNESAQAAAESLPEATDEAPGEVPSAVREALDDSAQTPGAALMLLAAEIERRVRQLAAQTGQLYANPEAWTRGRPVTANTLRLFGLSPPILEALDRFRHVRNRIVHGREATDHEVLRAIDSAVAILDALDRVPREVNTVYATDVPLYSDPDGTHEREHVRAVVLRTFHTDTPNQSTLRVYPTTRTHFRQNEPVAWEWDTSRVWPESWYRNPDTDEIEYAFTSSGEFVGTPLAEL
jgi:hypothetical protein